MLFLISLPPNTPGTAGADGVSGRRALGACSSAADPGVPCARRRPKPAYGLSSPRPSPPPGRGSPARASPCNIYFLTGPVFGISGGPTGYEKVCARVVKRQKFIHQERGKGVSFFFYKHIETHTQTHLRVIRRANSLTKGVSVCVFLCVSILSSHPRYNFLSECIIRRYRFRRFQNLRKFTQLGK